MWFWKGLVVGLGLGLGLVGERGRKGVAWCALSVRVAEWVAGVGTLRVVDNMMGVCCVLHG